MASWRIRSMPRLETVFKPLPPATAIRADWQSVLIALTGGALSGLAYPRFGLWPLIFVSVAALLWLFRGQTVRNSAWLGFVSGQGFYIAQIYWISQYLGPIPLIALSTLQALIFAGGGVALTLCWRVLDRWQHPAVRLFTPLALAAVWLTREWVSTHWPYGGFPWARVATSQADSPFGRLAFLGGLPLITFVVVAIAAYALVFLTSTVRTIRLGALALAATAIGLTLVTPVATVGDQSIKIAAVQGNANAGLFANNGRGSIFAKHLAASSGLLQKQNLDLVIWPENAVDINPLADAGTAVRISDFVQTTDTPLMFGSITQNADEYFNSSLLWLPNQGMVDQYDKKRPVPFAEYVPDRAFWASLAPDLIGLIWHDYTFGTRDGIFEVAGTKIGVNICFEVASDELHRELVSQGAQLIVSQTNNADFGHSDETYQQAAIAKLRAIETGRTVVNDSTVGVTAVFLSDGRTLGELPAFEPGALVVDAPLQSEIAPSFQLAPALETGALSFTVAVMIFALYRAARTRRAGE